RTADPAGLLTVRRSSPLRVNIFPDAATPNASSEILYSSPNRGMNAKPWPSSPSWAPLGNEQAAAGGRTSPLQRNVLTGLGYSYPTSTRRSPPNNMSSTSSWVNAGWGCSSSPGPTQTRSGSPTTPPPGVKLVAGYGAGNWAVAVPTVTTAVTTT